MHEIYGCSVVGLGIKEVLGLRIRTICFFTAVVGLIEEICRQGFNVNRIWAIQARKSHHAHASQCA
jgi:hypothetical protein